MSQETDCLLNERFGIGQAVSSIRENLEWVLTRHEHYGATNLLRLTKDANPFAPTYLLEVETESGYGYTFVLGRYTPEEVEKLMWGFPPTNQEFKTE